MGSNLEVTSPGVPPQHHLVPTEILAKKQYGGSGGGGDGGAPQGGCTLVAGEGAEEAEMSTSTHYPACALGLPAIPRPPALPPSVHHPAGVSQ